MSKQKIVGFDVDGVLADFGAAFLKVAETTLGRPFAPGYQPSTWEWSDIMSREEFGKVWRACMEIEDFWYDVEPMHDFNIMRTWFRSHNWTDREIWFVSSRKNGAGRTALEQTEGWLEYWLGGATARVVVVKHANEKRDIVRALGIEYFIDDFAPTIHSLSDITNAFLLEKAWNESDRTHYKLRSVSDIATYLARIEV